MDRNEVARLLCRQPNCKSVDRAMAVVSQGLELAADLEGGTEVDLE